jgi:hypothetical protein
VVGVVGADRRRRRIVELVVATEPERVRRFRPNQAMRRGTSPDFYIR